MAYITGKINNGNCFAYEYNNGVYDVWPEVEKSYYRSGETNVWYRFYAKIMGEENEKITIRLNWPHFEHYMINGGYGSNGKDSFSYMASPYNTVVPDIVYISYDQINWEHYDSKNIRFEVNNETVIIDLKLKQKITYISVGYPYTKTMLSKLESDVKDSKYVKCVTLNDNIGGEKLNLYTCTDFCVSQSEKKTIFYMAAQHCDETIGSNLADEMIRYICSPEAEQIRKKYIFHIVPVVSVFGFVQGRGRHGAGNPAREWGDFSLSEISAVNKFIKQIISDGEKIALALDVHTGVHVDPPTVQFCAAGFWVYEDSGKNSVARGTKLAKKLIQSGDFPPTCIYYKNCQEGSFVPYAYKLGIENVHTVECGRVCGYDSKLKKAMIYTGGFIKQWAKDFTVCLAEFLE